MKVDLINYDKIKKDINIKEILKSDIEIRDHKWAVIYLKNGIIRIFYQEKYNYVFEKCSSNKFIRKEFKSLNDLILSGLIYDHIWEE